jgi:hypothetical protein
MSVHVSGILPIHPKSFGKPGLFTSLSCSVPCAAGVGSPYRKKSTRSYVPASECRRAVFLNLHEDGKAVQHR